MDINERWIQFSGKAIVPQKLDREHNLIVSGEFIIGDLVSKPNQDGTEDIIYKLTPNRVVVDIGGKKARAKVKGRSSQRLRMALWHEFQKTNLDEALFDKWYEEEIDKIITNLNEIRTLTGRNK